MDWLKKLFSGSKKENKKGTFGEGAFSTAGAILIALAIRWALFEAYVIPSGSMLPTLLIHDHIFVNKYVYGIRVPFSKSWLAKFNEVKRGEVIVFRYPEDESIFFIKRVIGIPGDKVHYADGVLHINDKKVERFEPSRPEAMDYVRDFDLSGGKEEYAHFDEAFDDVRHSTLLRRGEYHVGAGPLTVPEGMLFVMGDNRDASNDSRFWGYVPQENVLGRAMFVWLSCEQTLPVLSFLCNPVTVRWKRFFHSIE